MKQYTEKMLCIMPGDRELCCAAWPVLQAWLRDFKKKMEMGVSVSEPTEFYLDYNIQLAESTLQMFFKAGAKLDIPPVREEITTPDLILNFSDDVVNVAEKSGKHASQYCGMLCGVGASPFPVVTRVKARVHTAGRVWGILPGLDLRYFPIGESQQIDPEQVVCLGNGEYSGIIGYASWATYIACAKGLPVIEIVPEGRSRTWLSKWSHKYYRAISEKGFNSNPVFYVEQARRNLEMCIEYMAGKESTDQVQ